VISERFFWWPITEPSANIVAESKTCNILYVAAMWCCEGVSHRWQTRLAVSLDW
jgi:hypothetical protein